MADNEVEGRFLAYPTIVEKEGKLVRLKDGPKGDWEAMKYALKTGEFAEFATKEDAHNWAEGGYKKGTPLENFDDKNGSAQQKNTEEKLKKLTSLQASGSPMEQKFATEAINRINAEKDLERVKKDKEESKRLGIEKNSSDAFFNSMVTGGGRTSPDPSFNPYTDTESQKQMKAQSAKAVEKTFDEDEKNNTISSADHILTTIGNSSDAHDVTSVVDDFNQKYKEWDETKDPLRADLLKDSEANLNAVFDDNERDFLETYKDRPQYYAEQKDKYNQLKERQRNGVKLDLQDEKYLNNIRRKSLDAKYTIDQARIYKIEKSVDLETFNTELAALATTFTDLEAEGIKLDADAKTANKEIKKATDPIRQQYTPKEERYKEVGEKLKSIGASLEEHQKMIDSGGGDQDSIIKNYNLLANEYNANKKEADSLFGELTQLESAMTAAGAPYVSDINSRGEGYKAKATELEQKIAEVKKRTGVSDDVLDQLNDAYKKTAAYESLYKISSAQYNDVTYSAGMERIRQEQRKENGNVLTEAFRGFVSTLGNIAYSTLQMPKALGLEDSSEYGGVDRMYDFAQDIIDSSQGTWGALSGADTPAALKAAYNVGGGVGSTVVFMGTGGAASLLGVSTKAATMIGTAMLSGAQNYQAGLDANMDTRSAQLYSIFSTALQGRLEGIYDDSRIVSDALKTTVIREFKKGKTMKESFSFALSQLPKSGLKHGEDILNEVKEEITSDLGMGFANEGVNAAAGKNYFTDSFSKEGISETGYITIGSTGILTLLKSSKGLDPMSRKAFLQNVRKHEKIVAGLGKDDKGYEEAKTLLDQMKMNLETLEGHSNWGNMTDSQREYALDLTRQMYVIDGEEAKASKLGVKDAAAEDDKKRLQGLLDNMLANPSPQAHTEMVESNTMKVLDAIRNSKEYSQGLVESHPSWSKLTTEQQQQVKDLSKELIQKQDNVNTLANVGIENAALKSGLDAIQNKISSILNNGKLFSDVEKHGYLSDLNSKDKLNAGETDLKSQTKPTFDNVPISTNTQEEVETAKNEVFDNLNKLEVGSVIENSDGEIKVVTEKSTDKKGNQLIGIVTYERQEDGSLRQMSNQVWASKSADGKLKLDYNPHSTGTNSKGERVTVTDKITDKKIDLSKENVFAEDENGTLVQTNKAKVNAGEKVDVKSNTAEVLAEVKGDAGKDAYAPDDKGNISVQKYFNNEPIGDGIFSWDEFVYDEEHTSKEEVSIEDIVPTQKNLNFNSLKINENTPELIKLNGKYYVFDGHHRIANAVKEGKKNVEALVFDLNDKAKSENYYPQIEQAIAESTQADTSKSREADKSKESLPDTTTDLTNEDIKETLSPVGVRMAEINNELKNTGVSLDVDMDGQNIIIRDKDGELIELEDLNENQRKIANEFIDLSTKLDGSVGDLLSGDIINEGEKKFQGEEAEATEVKNELTEGKDVYSLEEAEKDDAFHTVGYPNSFKGIGTDVGTVGNVKKGDKVEAFGKNYVVSAVMGKKVSMLEVTEDGKFIRNGKKTVEEVDEVDEGDNAVATESKPREADETKEASPKTPPVSEDKSDTSNVSPEVKEKLKRFKEKYKGASFRLDSKSDDSVLQKLEAWVGEVRNNIRNLVNIPIIKITKKLSDNKIPMKKVSEKNFGASKQHSDPNLRTNKPQFIDASELDGKTYALNPSDHLTVGVDPKTGVFMEGGIENPLIKKNADNGVGWSVDAKGVVTKMVNAAKKTGGRVATYIMGEGSNHSNEAVYKHWLYDVKDRLTKTDKGGRVDDRKAKLFVRLAKAMVGDIINRSGGKKELLGEVKDINSIDDLIRFIDSPKVPRNLKAFIVDGLTHSDAQEATKPIGKLQKENGVKSIEEVLQSISADPVNGSSIGDIAMVFEIDIERHEKEWAKHGKPLTYEEAGLGSIAHPNYEYPIYVKKGSVKYLREQPNILDISPELRAVVHGEVRAGDVSEGKGYSMDMAKSNTIRTAGLKGYTPDNLLGRPAPFDAGKESPFKTFTRLLKRAFPNIEVVDTVEGFNRAMGELNSRKLITKNGKVYGVVLDGKVHLNPKFASFNTPIHEFGHVWLDVVKSERPEIYEKGLELLSNDEVGGAYIDLVNKNPEYQRIVKEMRKSGVSEAEIDEYTKNEALASLIGDKGELFFKEISRKQGKLSPKDLTLVDKIKQWIDEFYTAIKELSGIHNFKGDFSNMSLSNYVDAVLGEIAGGKKISDITSEQLKKISPEGQGKLQIIGETGAERLDNAEMVLNDLSVAREMEKAGKTPKEIHLATSWERGADGKWRNEIPDVTLNKNILGRSLQDVFDAINFSDYKKIGALVDKDSELFKAYPSLLDVVIKADDTLGAIAAWSDGVIKINTKRIESFEELRSTIIHEIQHAIQEQEGFARGGNVTEFEDATNERIKDQAEFEKEQLEKLYKREPLSRDIILEFGEAPNYEELKKLYETIADKYDVSTKVVKDAANYLYELIGDNPTMENYVAKIQFLEKVKSDHDSFQKYKRLAGEVEARNAQKRMGYTLEQRRAEMLLETEDVARDQQIILNNAINGAQASMADESEMSSDLSDIIKDLREEGKTDAEIRDIIKNELGESDAKIDELMSPPVVSAEESFNQIRDNMINGEPKALKTVAQSFMDSDMEQEKKDRLMNDLSVALQSTSYEELEAAGKQVIDGLGGIEKAYAEVNKVGTTMPIEVRSVVYGEAIKFAQSMQEAAKTQAEKDKWADYEIEAKSELSKMAYKMGLFGSYISQIYEQSPYSLVRETKKAIDAKNKLFAPQAEAHADEILDTLEDPIHTEESFEQALREAVELSNAKRDKRIADLEKKLRKVQAESRPSVPKKRNYRYTDSDKKKFLDGIKNLKSGGGPLIILNSALSNPELWKNLGGLAGYYLERGYYKFEDLYKKLKKDLGGEFEDSYADLYNSQKQVAIENGVDPKEFDSDEAVEAMAQEMFAEEARLQEEIANLKAEKIQADKDKKAKTELESKRNALSKRMSQSLPSSDSDRRSRKEKMLADAMDLDSQYGGTAYTDAVNDYFDISDDVTRDKKEKAALEAKKRAFFRKMSETQPSQNLADPRKRNQKLIDDARELDAVQGGNTYERQARAYIDGAKSIGDIIKEGLIDAGYFKEVNGEKQVDWHKVTTAGKTTQEIVDAIRTHVENTIPGSQLGAVLPLIMQRVDTLVNEKKAAAIDAKVNRINAGKARSISSRLGRKTRIANLIDTWKQGGLDRKEVLEKMASDLGITSFTKENNRWIQDKIKEIDAAPIGAERELLEEQLQAYLEDLNAPYFSIKRILERNKARLLSGFMTAYKNITGGSGDAMVMALYKNLVAQISTRGLGDKEIMKVTKRAHARALSILLDIQLNGGVDEGIAISETTETKEGSPRIRTMENERKKLFKALWVDIMGKQVNVNPINLEKYFSRSMAAADAFNSVILQEIESYKFIKNDLMKKNPSMSAREASRKAYEISYSVEIAEAEERAAAEFKERGIPLSPTAAQGVAARARFNRRVHEIVAENRGKAATMAGQKFANRYTYKHTERFAMWVVVETLSKVRGLGAMLAAKMRKEALAEDNKLLYRSSEVFDATWNTAFDTFLPFIKGIGNVIEKGLEYTPAFGFSKAAFFGIVAAYNKLSPNNKNDVTFERAGEYAFRATIGMMAMALMKSLLDDDDEDKEKNAIYGMGSDNFVERSNRAKQRPQNSMSIGGHSISLELLGPFYIAAKMEAEKADIERYGLDKVATAGSMAASMASDAYLNQTSQMFRAFQSTEEKEDAYIAKVSAEFITRTLIPFTSSMRQMEQVIDPVSKKPLTFWNQLEKQSGLLMGWKNGVPLAVDYMGRNYDVGEIYLSGPDGFRKAFGTKKPLTAGERLVLLYNPALTKLNQGDDKMEVPDVNYVYAPLGSVDFFDVQSNASRKFGKLMEAFASTNPEELAALGTKNFTPAKVEEFMRKAETKLKAEGKDVQNLALVQEEAAKLFLATNKGEIMKEEISNLSKMAKNAAIVEYYQSRGMRIPITMIGAIEVYDKRLETFNIKK